MTVVPSPSPSDLRHAIAETLRREVKDYELDGVCDRLGLPAGDGSPPNWNSKAVHVRWRLAAVDLAGLREIALRVADEFGAEDLALVVAAAGGVRGVDGRPQNLIFAATGPKPRIVLRDAIDNVIEIVEGADRVLVVEEPPPEGLTWGGLVDRLGGDAEAVYRRLDASLGSDAERKVMRAYGARYRDPAVPALLPQVYLHYDPYTRRQLGEVGQELARQRMDFLLLPAPRPADRHRGRRSASLRRRGRARLPARVRRDGLRGSAAQAGRV